METSTYTTKREDRDNVAYIDMLSCMNLQPHVSCPTHTAGNTLDHIISSLETQIEFTVPCDDLILSDHSIVSMRLSLQRDDIQRQSINYRPLKKVNPQDVRDRLSSITSNTVYDSIDTIDNTLSSLNQDLTKLVDDLAPFKMKRLATRKQHVWFREELPTLKHNKRRLEKQWRYAKTSKNCNLYKQ